MLEEVTDLPRPVKDVARRVELALGRANLRIEGDAALGFAMGLAVGVLYTLRTIAPK